MSSKSTNNQGRRTPLTLSQSKFSSSQPQQMNKRPTTANKTESAPQREQETRSKQQQQQQQQQQQHQQQQKQQHLRKEEERKEAAATAASAAGPVPAVIIPNTEHKEQQQQAAVALNNGYNKNEAKNGTVTNAATNGNQSSANTQVNEVKQDRETRQNSTTKQAKEQEQQQPQQNNNAAATANTTTKSANAVPTTTVQRKQQLQAAELKTPPSPNAKKHVEEKMETKQQATMPVVEKTEALNKAKQQATVQPESVTTNSSPANKKPAQQQSPSSNKKELPQETQKQAEVLEKPIVSIPITAELQPAKTVTTGSSPTIAPKISPVKKYTVTTAVDVTNMDVSPQKSSSNIKVATVAVADNPNATSTPDKYLKSGWLQGFNTPEHAKSVPMRNLAISGRRSIHREWSEYENNANLRGSYRRIKTDLDSTADTNTSLNVTVGSERANSSWFSFSSRKRERTPNNVEGIKDELMSPPKRARFESLFSIMASPLTALRSRFAKTTIHANSSPIKSIMEEQEEKNVSMQEQESIQEVEDLSPLDVIETKKNTSSEELNNKEEEAEKLSVNSSTAKEAKENDDIVDLVGSDDDADIEILEATDSSNTVAHKKRCDIM